MTDKTNEHDNDAQHRRETDRVKYLIIEDHINPIRERLIGVEKAIDYEQKITTERFNSVDDRMGRAEKKLDTIEGKVDANHELVKKMWNFMWGLSSAIVVIWAVLKFVLPMLASLPIQ